MEKTGITPLLLTRRQTAHLLGVCERTVSHLTERGELPAMRIGVAVRYRRSDIEAWIEKKIADCA